MTFMMAHALQVYLDDGDYRALKTWAAQRGWTMSQAVRIALRALTRSEDQDPLLSGSGMVEGLPADLSERFDRYLGLTYLAEAPAPYGKTRRQRTRKSVRR
jgi:hypothetical protein